MIVVIGASGFIGTYLVKELVEQGYDVVATGRNKDVAPFFNGLSVPYISLDICDKKEYAKLPVDNVQAVVLLAALLPANVKHYNPMDYIRVNIEGTLNVLEYCRENNIKKIISTTSYADVSNFWKKDTPLSDDIPRGFGFTGDHAMYVISKNAATDIIEHYSQEFGLKGTVFRLPPVYGYGPHGVIYVDGQAYKSGIQTFIENAIEGKDIEIWGDSSTSRDVVYVKDVVRAIILAMNSKNAQGVYNLTSGQSTSLEEQVQVVIDIFSLGDRKSKIVYRPERKNTTPSYVFDISKACRDFDYEPKYIPFRKMMEDYKKEMESKRFTFFQQRNIKE